MFSVFFVLQQYGTQSCSFAFFPFYLHSQKKDGENCRLLRFGKKPTAFPSKKSRSSFCATKISYHTLGTSAILSA
jgi:hypothetical protein